MGSVDKYPFLWIIVYCHRSQFTVYCDLDIISLNIFWLLCTVTLGMKRQDLKHNLFTPICNIMTEIWTFRINIFSPIPDNTGGSRCVIRANLCYEFTCYWGSFLFSKLPLTICSSWCNFLSLSSDHGGQQCSFLHNIKPIIIKNISTF